MSRERVAARPIRFGTSGWRGVLGDEITAPRARALAAAIARWAAGEIGRRPRIAIGHDTRFLGRELVAEIAAVLAAHGAHVRRVASPVPTPVVAHAVRETRADVGVIVTASHNRPADHGVKVIAPWGGGITAEQAQRIERLAEAALSRGEPRRSPRAPEPLVDLVAPYLATVAKLLDPAARAHAPRVLYDALHGTGTGVADRALAALGCAVRVLHAEPSARFGGAAPDPTPARLAELAQAVRRERGRCIGLATDGDADRYAVLDGRGRALSETASLALLVDHLARTGRVRRGVAVSIATGTLVERVAREHGLPVERHPIGFKHLSSALAAGVADVAGEESGGFAWDPVARDKDGILACVLFAEMLALTGEAPEQRLRALERRHGRRLCGRVAHAARPAARARLAAIATAPPNRVGRSTVVHVDDRDGVRLGFDDGFLMLRASGTEGVLRIYAEAPDADALARRFDAGARLLGLA